MLAARGRETWVGLGFGVRARARARASLLHGRGRPLVGKVRIVGNAFEQRDLWLGLELGIGLGLGPG